MKRFALAMKPQDGNNHPGEQIHALHNDHQMSMPMNHLRPDLHQSPHGSCADGQMGVHLDGEHGHPSMQLRDRPCPRDRRACWSLPARIAKEAAMKRQKPAIGA
jgi:hypothetical protein